jgi:hypothetical protein
LSELKKELENEKNRYLEISNSLSLKDRKELEEDI